MIPVSRRLDFSEIPVVDISALVEGRSAIDATVAALDQACRDVGFLYIRNHGVSPATIDRLVEQTKLFFALPLEEKQAIALDQRMRGYIPLNYRSWEGEKRAGTSHQEGLWIGHERPLSDAAWFDGPNPWPVSLPGLKPAMMNYFAEVERVGVALMRGFGAALGLGREHFVKLFDHATSRLKPNHYPPQDNPEDVNDIGVVPHSDSGGFTVLWQDDNGGLEVQSKSGEWVGAPPIPGTFVVNIGNVMQIWTNGRYSSTPHRVINRNGRDRYSIPLFFNPGASAPITPLVGVATPDPNPLLYGKYQKDEWRRIFPIAKIPA